MGCASSAALPFLTAKDTQDATSVNGIQRVQASLSENGLDTLRNVNESYVSEKMKEVVDSTAVQGVIGGVVQAKEDICNQVKEVGDAITGTVSSVINDVEDMAESTLGKIAGTVGAVEGKVISGLESVQGEIKSLFGGEGSNEKIADSIKQEDIDELLNALPNEEVTSDEVIKEAVEEVKEETEEN